MNDRSQTPSTGHQPVMPHEALHFLRCAPGGIYVDATLGLGGHAELILEKIMPGGLLIGVDRDRESLEIARARLDSFSDGIRLLHDNYKNLPLILNNLARPPLDGILLDLGVSSRQLLSPERGFSFQSEGMLDMRMDRTQRQTAADLVNDLPEEQLSDLIHRFGEERHARRIAAAITRARSEGRITRPVQLAEIVRRAVRARGPQRIDRATRTFQALRIAVNRELEGLEELLIESLPFLQPGGRIVVISFHSLEDRIVKQTFRKLAGRCVCGRPAALCTCPRRVQAASLTHRPVSASPAEVASNPRARSARLRAVERVQALD
ncbi:MAG: 16S rRNA (cytosine(1402)-N(4))-methyltransferase RsmH [Gammaproteobacteria bacterium]